MKKEYKIKIKEETPDGYNYLSGDIGDENEQSLWGWSKEGDALIFALEKAKRIQKLFYFPTELIKTI